MKPGKAYVVNGTWALNLEARSNLHARNSPTCGLSVFGNILFPPQG
jgi:hypothetical protein